MTNVFGLLSLAVVLPIGGGARAQSAAMRGTVPVPGSAGPVDSLARVIARAGYVAVPFHRGPHHDFRYVDVMVDTTPARLLLDSGCLCELVLDPSYRTALMRQLVPVAGASRSRWALVNGIRLGPVTLDASSVDFNTVPALANALPGANGLFGVWFLSRYQAIIDDVADTLYLMPPAVGSFPAGPPPPPPPASRSLLAALEAAGQYRTFISLARRAGLASLLDGAAVGSPSTGSPSAEPPTWNPPRAPALALGADDSGQYDSERQDQALTERLYRPGRLTAFVPTDAAFAHLPPGILAALQADSARLARVLRDHLLTGAALDLETLRTLIAGAGPRNGARFGFHPVGAATDVEQLSDSGRRVARARIVDPDRMAGNGVAHGIDRVFLASAGPAGPTAVTTLLMQQGYTALPMSRLPTGWYTVQATMNAIPETLMIETGAGGTATETFDVFLSVLPPSDTAEPVLELGGRTVTPVKVGEDSATDGSYDGLLGSRFLAQHKARIDWATGTLFLRLP